MPKRNLRATTIQASMAVRAKSLGSTDMNAIQGLYNKGRPSLAKPCADKKLVVGAPGKENIAPGKDLFPKDFVEDWEDLDAEDIGDPLMVAEYAPEIFEYMMGLEV